MPPGIFRFFLATVVVVHHSFPLRLGGWAVGMFFVLSGFWISRMWRSTYSAFPRPVTSFYISRWWRLAPLFICVQALAVLSWLSLERSKWPAELFSECWWITQVAVIGSTQFGRLLPPAWSLDVEAQFYFLAPWTCMFLMWTMASFRGRRFWLPQSLVLGLVTISILQFLRGSSLETPHLHLYAWLFVSGIFCDLFQWKPPRRLVFFSAITFLFFTAVLVVIPATRSWVWVSGSSGQGSRWGGLIYYYVATIIAIPFAIDTVQRRTSKWDMWLADLSYPLYLFHWFPRDWYYTHFDLSKGYSRNIPLLLANFAIAFLGAVVLLHLVDRPAQKLRKQWLRRGN